MKHKSPCFSLLLITLAAFVYARAVEPTVDSTPSVPQEPAAPPAADKPSATPAGWADLKGVTYDQRDVFLAGLKDLEAHVDQQIEELVTQRAAMAKANISTNAWDLNMQEMSTARTNLKST